MIARRYRVEAKICGGMTKPSVVRLLFASLSVLLVQPVHAACRSIDDVPAVKINPITQAALQAMDINRALAFEILRRVAVPETRGCWAGSTGNFDKQIVSVGSMQWNYGQKTLQFLLFKYRESFLTQAAFDQEIQRLMPKHGATIFSEGCRHETLSAACKSYLLAHQTNGRLSPDLAEEYDALFNSDPMIQIQVDRFLSILTSVSSDIKRLFGDGKPTQLRVKWAIDTKIQQGSFPTNAKIDAYRKATAKLDANGRRQQLLSIVNWYNTEAWTSAINKIYTEAPDSPREKEIFDLVNLSYIRAQDANGNGGAYRALALQRRVTIVLDKGSVAGRRF
jgi:hypothetical protein